MAMYAFKCGNWRGVISAATMKELFWSIDEHLDPWQAKVRRISDVSLCWNIGVDEVPVTDDIDSGVSYARTKFELGDRTVDEVELSGDKWRVIDWHKYEVYGKGEQK